eukprot:c46065_g1_i1 orf=46-255(+)
MNLHLVVDFWKECSTLDLAIGCQVLEAFLPGIHLQGMLANIHHALTKQFKSCGRFSNISWDLLRIVTER